MRIHFSCNRVVKNPIFTVSFFNLERLLIASNYSNHDGCLIDKISGTGYIDYHLSKINLNPSKYTCTVTLSETDSVNTLDWHENYYSFIIAGNTSNYGLVNPFPIWELSQSKSKSRINIK